MPTKWIITDIDGCLTPEESVPWDLEAFWEFARISREASAGSGKVAPFVLCTGRPQPYAECLMKLLDIRAPAICENGAVIYTLNDNHARYGPGVSEEKILGLRDVRAFIETELLGRYPECFLQFGKEAQISVFSEKPEVFPALADAIEHYTSRQKGPDLLINASHFYLNISLAGVDKGNAITSVAEELNVESSDLAGIGDTVGDIPIQRNVRFFACPANAQPEAQTVADYVSPFRNMAGVLDILKQPAFLKDQA
jgi:HAD superfamily hydrolase (TIGR01484 family)